MSLEEQILPAISFYGFYSEFVDNRPIGLLFNVFLFNVPAFFAGYVGYAIRRCA